MDFRYKNFLQHVFSSLPRGERLNYLFQSRVTKNLPRKEDIFCQWSRRAKEHVDAYHRYHQIASPKLTYYEFGAGWDLLNPLATRFLGFKEVTAIDIRRLIYPDLIQNTIDRFHSLGDKIPFSAPATPEKDRLTAGNCVQVLKDRYQLFYYAPKDARDTGFPSDGIDLIVSNMTFEHIPPGDILPILTESYRLLAPGGILSTTIDYRDHWSYFDSNVSPYHYLGYSEQGWKKYNPDLHYQNRLRHSDYMKDIRAVGFEVLEERLVQPTEAELRTLDTIQLDERYKSYAKDDLIALESFLVLRKPVNGGAHQRR